MAHRVNISFSSKEFHEKAVRHAETEHHADFSAMITRLILDDMNARKSAAAIAAAQTAKRARKKRGESP